MLNNMLSYIAYYQNFNKKKNKKQNKKGATNIVLQKEKVIYLYLSRPQYKMSSAQKTL
jgi:hypothetical protein